MEGGVRVARLERALDAGQFVTELLEPQLVDLVDDDEQQLIVLGSVGAARALFLEREQFRDLEVGRIRDGWSGHQSMVLGLVGREPVRINQSRGRIRMIRTVSGSSPITSPSCGVAPSQRR